MKVLAFLLVSLFSVTYVSAERVTCALSLSGYWLDVLECGLYDDDGIKEDAPELEKVLVFPEVRPPARSRFFSKGDLLKDYSAAFLGRLKLEEGEWAVWNQTAMVLVVHANEAKVEVLRHYVEIGAHWPLNVGGAIKLYSIQRERIRENNEWSLAKLKDAQAVEICNVPVQGRLGIQMEIAWSDGEIGDFGKLQLEPVLSSDKRVLTSALRFEANVRSAGVRVKLDSDVMLKDGNLRYYALGSGYDFDYFYVLEVGIRPYLLNGLPLDDYLRFEDEKEGQIEDLWPYNGRLLVENGLSLISAYSPMELRVLGESTTQEGEDPFAVRKEVNPSVTAKKYRKYLAEQWPKELLPLRGYSLLYDLRALLTSLGIKLHEDEWCFWDSKTERIFCKVRPNSENMLESAFVGLGGEHNAFLQVEALLNQANGVDVKLPLFNGKAASILLGQLDAEGVLLKSVFLEAEATLGATRRIMDLTYHLETTGSQILTTTSSLTLPIDHWTNINQKSEKNVSFRGRVHVPQGKWNEDIWPGR